MTEAQSPQRTWIVVVVVCSAVVGALALALVVYLATGSGESTSPAAAPDSSRWLAATGETGTDLVRVDLGPGGEAVPVDVSAVAHSPYVYTFAGADGVTVRVQTLTLYNEGWDDGQELNGLVQDYRDSYLVECSSAKASGSDGSPLPTGTAATGAYVRVVVTCEPRTGQDPGYHELYAFAAEPHRTNPDNVAHDWVLVAASGKQAETVRPVLERAVATVGLGSDDAKSPSATGSVPQDPGPARNRYTVSIWPDTHGFYFPAGWSVVGAGGFDVVAPEQAGVDAVRGYASPGIVLARNDPKPGGKQSTSTLSDGLVDRYAEAAVNELCTERTDFEPSGDATAEIRWSGCPNGLVDRVLVRPDDSGGVILISVRASDEQVADDLVQELAG